MDDTWGSAFDQIDWDAVDRENKRDALEEYFWQDSFDDTRGYVRRILTERPDIFDEYKIAVAAEQMLESHMEGVELSVEDALRFVENDNPATIKDLVKMLTDAGISDDNVMDVISKVDMRLGQTIDGVKAKGSHTKARLLTACADVLARNKDILILGIPTFDPEQNWTQVKLAVFSETMTDREKKVLEYMIGNADKSRMKVENGVAVLTFQIDNIWANFE